MARGNFRLSVHYSPESPCFRLFMHQVPIAGTFNVPDSFQYYRLAMRHILPLMSVRNAFRSSRSARNTRFLPRSPFPPLLLHHCHYYSFHQALTSASPLFWLPLLITSHHQALAIMALPSNVPPSIAELARLSDEIWFLAGDTSVDTSWYTKRATLSAVYSSTELFMTTDTSANHRETELFLDRRLREVQSMGKAVGSVGQWMGFTAAATINVLRSKGVRI